MGTRDSNRLVKLRINKDHRGSLISCDGINDIPFYIERVFWIYGVPAGETRGDHYHKHCRQVIFAIHGSVNLTIYDRNINGNLVSKQMKVYKLKEPNVGIFVDVNEGVVMSNFSHECICLVLASDLYDVKDLVSVDHNKAASVSSASYEPVYSYAFDHSIAGVSGA